jgi:molecular chaperone GrpE
MSKENQDQETMKEDEKNCSQDCTCDAPEGAQAEYAEAVDEQDAAQAEAATDELTKWRELAMRTAAEYDNYRKRCVKDREEFTRYANRGLLEELLPVVDNFEMGMMMAGQDTSSMIYIGMSMVQKQLGDFLASQGVEAIPTEVGQMFDHNVHEAIQSEPSDQPAGTILRVLRRGYNLKGRLLRPANVIVAAEPESAEKA